jgi:hypothetical protein
MFLSSTLDSTGVELPLFLWSSIRYENFGASMGKECSYGGIW